jgi:hypothetical protein
MLKQQIPDPGKQFEFTEKYKNLDINISITSGGANFWRQKFDKTAGLHPQ